MPGEPLRVADVAVAGLVVVVHRALERAQLRRIGHAEHAGGGVGERAVPGRVQVHAVLGPHRRVDEVGAGADVEQHRPVLVRDRREPLGEVGEPRGEEPRRGSVRHERGHEQHVGPGRPHRADRVAEPRGERRGIRSDADEVVRPDEHAHEVGAAARSRAAAALSTASATLRLRTATLA